MNQNTKKTMITINEIFTLIQEAIDRNKIIQTLKGNKDYRIIIENDNKISIYYCELINSIIIRYNEYDDVKIEKLSELEIAKFKLLVTEAHEYSKNKTVEGIKNFFSKNTDSRPKDINDLDNEDD